MIRTFLSGMVRKNTFGKRSSDENQEDPAMIDQGAKCYFIVKLHRNVGIKKHVNNFENRHCGRSRQNSVLLKDIRRKLVGNFFPVCSTDSLFSSDKLPLQNQTLF